MPDVLWSWWDNDALQWKFHIALQSAAIDKAYSALHLHANPCQAHESKQVFNFKVRGASYKIDFVHMAQTNIHTGFSQEIQRIVVNAPPPPPPARAEEEDNYEVPVIATAPMTCGAAAAAAAAHGLYEQADPNQPALYDGNGASAAAADGDDIYEPFDQSQPASSISG